MPNTPFFGPTSGTTGLVQNQFDPYLMQFNQQFPGGAPHGAAAGGGGGATAGTGTAGSQSQQFLESVLPGITNLTSSATGVIGNLLNGLPSPSTTRTANAYFGVGAGQPDTGGVNTFIGNRGADLYGQQANQYQQQGLNDLLQTIGTYTSPALGNQGQQLQNQQFYSQLGQQGQEFQQQNALAQFQAMLQALSLGNNITGQLPGNININPSQLP